MCAGAMKFPAQLHPMSNRRDEGRQLPMIAIHWYTRVTTPRKFIDER